MSFASEREMQEAIDSLNMEAFEGHKMSIQKVDLEAEEDSEKTLNMAAESD